MAAMLLIRVSGKSIAATAAPTGARPCYPAASRPPGAAVSQPRLLIALAIGACGLALAVASCDRERPPGGGDDSPATGTTTAPRSLDREGRLRLLALPGYAERGGNDPGVDWISGFEQRSGCQVEMETVADEATLLARMAGDGIDAAIVPGDLALTLVATGDVRPIETDRVPLLDGVDPRLRAAAAVQHGGEDFGIVFAWRPLVLRYRAELVPQPPGSVLLYSPVTLRDGAPSAGRVQAIDSPLAIAQAALYLAQAQPALGIRDPFALDANQYAAALALVRAQKALLHRWWRDRAEQDADFLHAGVAVASGWAGGDWRRAAIDPADAASIAWIAPGEGVIARADSSMLHARAAHPNCAYAWFDWSLEPRVQAQAAHWLGAVPAVPAACRADDRLGEAGCRANGSELLAQARFARVPQATCARAWGCMPYSQWTRDFHAIRGE